MWSRFSSPVTRSSSGKSSSSLRKLVVRDSLPRLEAEPTRIDSTSNFIFESVEAGRPSSTKSPENALYSEFFSNFQHFFKKISGTFGLFLSSKFRYWFKNMLIFPTNVFFLNLKIFENREIQKGFKNREIQKGFKNRKI